MTPPTDIAPHSEGPACERARTQGETDWTYSALPDTRVLEGRISELHDQEAALIAYLHSKLKAKDWHAVQDAASDIREINAKLEVLSR